MPERHSVSQLLLEVTQRCNLDCEHCLRGSGRPVDMSDDIIRSVFRVINYAGTLSFTGGEPLMVPHVLRRIWAIAEEEGFTWGTFWVSTNGVLLTPENVGLLVMFLMSGREFPYGGGAIQISVSPFHLAAGQKLARPFDTLWETHKILKKPEGRGEYPYPFFFFKEGPAAAGPGLIGEGKGFGLGGRARPMLADPGDIYVSADGRVLPFCDLAYESQAACQVGRVADLATIIPEVERLWEEAEHMEMPFDIRVAEGEE